MRLKIKPTFNPPFEGALKVHKGIVFIRCGHQFMSYYTPIQLNKFKLK